MTTLSLERLQLRRARLTPRLRHRWMAWSALVARSIQASHAYEGAATASARQKVLARFVDTGARQA